MRSLPCLPGQGVVIPLVWGISCLSFDLSLEWLSIVVVVLVLVVVQLSLQHPIFFIGAALMIWVSSSLPHSKLVGIVSAVHGIENPLR